MSEKIQIGVSAYGNYHRFNVSHDHDYDEFVQSALMPLICACGYGPWQAEAIGLALIASIQQPTSCADCPTAE